MNEFPSNIEDYPDCKGKVAAKSMYSKLKSENLLGYCYVIPSAHTCMVQCCTRDLEVYEHIVKVCEEENDHERTTRTTQVQ